MKQDFETLYQEMLNEEEIKKQWNVYKNGVKKKNTVFICIIIIIYFALKIYVPGEINVVQFFYILFLLGIIYIFFSVFSKNRQKFNNTFKQVIIKKLIKNFYQDIKYYPMRGISSNTYNEGKYEQYYNKYYSEDYFCGGVEQIGSIELAEVKTEKEETYRDREGKLHKETTTIFNGLFAKINIDKSIKTDLKIRTNWIGFRKKKNRLEMDSQLFEKYFDVFTDNQIIGMQLLTADVMEMLVEFKNTMKIEYDISIYQNKIYLRFMTGPMFEGKISTKQMLDKKSLEKYYKILEFTYTLSQQIIETIEHTEI